MKLSKLEKEAVCREFKSLQSTENITTRYISTLQFIPYPFPEINCFVYVEFENKNGNWKFLRIVK